MPSVRTIIAQAYRAFPPDFFPAIIAASLCDYPMIFLDIVYMLDMIRKIQTI
ncbi:MAG: hypothetical protein QME45_12755 [Clostridiales bacterium]|nr:hypothetical protein [Clostridiales bacterium]